MTESAHLSDVELVEFADDALAQPERAATSSHLSECPWCRLRLNGVADGPDLDPPADFRLDAPATVPAALSEAFRPERPEAESGQLWRLARDGVASLAFVIDIDEAYAVVVPVTFDTEMADTYTLIVSGDDSPLGLPLALFVSERTTVPVDALAQMVGQLDMVDVARGVHTAFRDDRDVDFAPVGRPVVRASDPRLEYHGALRGRFNVLGAPFLTGDRDPAPGQLEDVGQAVDSRLRAMDWVEPVADVRAERIRASVSPLQPLVVANVFDVPVRVCLSPSFEMLEDPDVSEAIDVLALLSDCELVAVVVPGDDLDTMILDPADISDPYVAPGRDARERRGWRTTGSLPLESAFAQLVDRYRPDFEPLGTGFLAPEQLDIAAVARAHAAEQIDDFRSKSPRIEPKKVALHGLTVADADALASLVVAAQTSASVELTEDLFDGLPAAAADMRPPDADGRRIPRAPASQTLVPGAVVQRLELRNWRAYTTLELSLEAATTFVVAKNGVGKTSLITGALWALFGDLADVNPRDERRVKDKLASAHVGMLLPDGRELLVTRLLEGKQVKVEAEVDGSGLDGEPELRQVLAEAYGADPRVLSRLAVIPEGAVRGERVEGDLLRRHLSEAFGVDALESAADAAERIAKAAARNTKDIRSLDVLLQSDRDEAQRKLEAIQSELAEKQEELEHRSAAVAALKERKDELEKWRRFAEATARHSETLEELTRETLALTGTEGLEPTEIAADRAVDELTSRRQSLLSLLDSLESSTESELDQIRRRRSEIEGRLAGLGELFSQLDAADASCPVCLQPLDDDTVEHARAEHRRHRAELEAELSGLADSAPLTDQLNKARELRRRLSNLQAPVAPAVDRPETPAGELDEAQLEAQERVDEAASAVAALREQERLLRRRLDDDSEAAAARADLVRVYRREALSTAAAAAMRGVAQEVVSARVEPLEQALRERWKQLMPRGALTFGPEGPWLERDGVRFDVGRLSGSEMTIALLLTRMLVLVGSTRGRFLWLDEPLEHLDPTNRRAVAATLVSAVEQGELEQVVVTTYEEPLARRLAARTGADLKYVTSDL
jgi:DNA repair exonuclease SbcCD ATPase subunit